MAGAARIGRGTSLLDDTKQHHASCAASCENGAIVSRTVKHTRRIAARIVKRRNARGPHLDGGASGRIELPILKPLRVLVAGEVILDRYIMGDVARVSPEAPIPILQVSRIEERPGNAGFVMANLRALGARVSALSVVGADRNGELLREMFS